MADSQGLTLILRMQDQASQAFKAMGSATNDLAKTTQNATTATNQQNADTDNMSKSLDGATGKIRALRARPRD